MSRRRLPWLLALPLMAAGSVAAHSVSYLLVGARAAESGNEVAERSAHGYAGHSTLVLGLVGALTLAGVVGRSLAAMRGRPSRELSVWSFLLLPPLAFALQELAERLLRAESFPFQAALEPRFLVGLLLQLPFGLAALLVARVLLRVAERLGRALAGAHARRARVPVRLWTPTSAADLPCVPVLALGHPGRGPPTR